MTPVRRPAGRANLNQEIAAHLREEIFAGRLRPGSRVDQDAVAEAAGVSKLPVREALISLEVEGLLVSVPRRGTFVATLTEADIEDHFKIFGAVSAMSAEIAAGELSEADVDELATLVTRMRSVSDAAELDRLNDELHRRINKSGSRRLRSVIRLLAGSMPAKFFEYAEGCEGTAHREHQEIVDALRARDASAAAEAVRRHFESSGALTVSLLRSRGFWDEESDDSTGRGK
ncbi:MAG: putative transcriptional regulator, GntR family [Marmoricola sp.]|jgi:DNA-binding GntR family transcriptional regulator|nr:putative transcriptional regulator, GntR family [Marmoricola sp.]